MIGAFWLSLSFVQSVQGAKARGRMSLYHSTVRSELERPSHPAYVRSRPTDKWHLDRHCQAAWP